MAKERITDLDKFIEVWQTALSVAEVAEKMGVAVNTCHLTANIMRKEGVPLVSFKGGRLRLVVQHNKDHFVALAQKFAPKEGH